MAILRIRDKNGVVREVLALKGDPGESPSDEALDAIIAIQDSLMRTDKIAEEESF